MKVALKIDDSRFRGKVRQLAVQSVFAGEKAIRIQGEHVARYCVEYSKKHVDTGRNLRGWQTCYNSIGVGRVPIQPVKPSRQREAIRAKLEAQVNRMGKVREQYGRWIKLQQQRKNHQNWPSYKKLVKEFDRIGDIEDRALEELALYDADESGAGLLIGGRSTKRRYSMSRLRTYRTGLRIFGGDSRVFRVGSNWLITIRNREPHSRILEYGGISSIGQYVPGRFIMRRAIHMGRAIGVSRKAATTYLKEAAKGTEMYRGQGRVLSARQV